MKIHYVSSSRVEFAVEWVASCGISSLVNCTGNDILCMNIHTHTNTHAVYTQPLQDEIFAITTKTLGVSIGGCCNCLVVWLFVRCWVFLFFHPALPRPARVLIVVGYFLDSFVLEVKFNWTLWHSFWTNSLEILIGFVQQGCYRVQFPLHYFNYYPWAGVNV